jgi:hypothetical protein
MHGLNECMKCIFVSLSASETKFACAMLSSLRHSSEVNCRLLVILVVLAENLRSLDWKRQEENKLLNYTEGC